jgi:hypothetical protein
MSEQIRFYQIGQLFTNEPEDLTNRVIHSRA